MLYSILLKLLCCKISLYYVAFIGKSREEYRAALGRFGLSGELALQSVITLSGGQKSRLAFASIAMAKYTLLRFSRHKHYRVSCGIF